MDLIRFLIEYLATVLQRQTMGPDLAPLQADFGISFFVMLAVSAALQYALAPTPAPAKAAAFEEFEFPQDLEGTLQAVIFGDVWIQDWTVIGVGNYRTTPILK